MNTKGNNLKGLYIVYAAFCAVLLGVAAVWDLQIDQFLNNTSSYFGEFLARFGEIPSYLVMPFAGMVFFASREKNIIKTIAGILLTVGGWGYLFSWYSGQWFKKDDFRDVFFVIFALIFSAFSLYIATKLPKDTMKKLQPYAIFVLIATVGAVLTTSIMKEIWGRVRFRDLLKEEDFSKFTAWYLPQGKTGNKSFPSGHTTAAASILQISALPVLFDKLKKYEARYFIVGAIYTFMIGFSRMIVGAHYLSDITVGALVGLTWYIVMRKVYLEKKA